MKTRSEQRDDNELISSTQRCTFLSRPNLSSLLLQDRDEAEQERDSTLQELYLQTERKNSRSSDASEAEEEEEDRQGIPLSISKWE